MVLFCVRLAGAFFATFFTVFLAAFLTAFLAVFLAAFFAAGSEALLLLAGRPLRLSGATFADPPSAASISADAFPHWQPWPVQKRDPSAEKPSQVATQQLPADIA